jgi:hypothetical protein
MGSDLGGATGLFPENIVYIFEGLLKHPYSPVLIVI